MNDNFPHDFREPRHADDILHEFRKPPPAEFAKALYEKLSKQDEKMNHTRYLTGG